MLTCGPLDYALARLQARHGQRADDAAWHRIEVMREFAPMLELARATALRHWLAGITADSSGAEIEAHLRGRWRAHVAEVHGWMPEAWQPALAWCALMPDLAVLQHLARGGAAPAWLHDDAAWRELAQAPPAARAGLLGAGPWAALAPAWPAPDTLGAAWLSVWRQRLPRGAAHDESILALQRTLADHGRRFAAAPPAQGWLLRLALQARLSLLLRRAALEPAAAFIHLAGAALDLERLRAELLRRVYFPPAQAA